MLRKTFFSCLVVAFLFTFVRANAQVAPGVFADANHPSGAPDPMKAQDIWHVDPISGSVSINIPFNTTPQGGRGPKLPFALLYNSGSTLTLQANGSVVLGDGSINIFDWSPTPLASVGSPGPSGPWTTTGPFFYSGYANIPDMGFTDTNGAYHVTGYGCSIDGPYTFVDETGSAHDMGLEGFSTNNGAPLARPCSDAQSASATYWPTSSTADGSAMATGNTFTTGPDGSRVTGRTITDPNGNAASLSTSGGVTTATDALGRTVYKTNLPIGQPGQIPAGSYYVTTYDANGNPENYTVTFANIAIGSFTMPHPTTSEISTSVYCIAASCPTGFTVNQPHAGDTFPALTEIDRPDGTSYTFAYDSTYGTIRQINFPTGGYVRFAWKVRDKDWNIYGQFLAISDIVVTDAYVSPGSGENRWIYDLASVSTSTVPKGTVTAPDGSYTDYTGACFIYTRVPLYQQNARQSCKENSRAIHSSGGTLMKTVNQTFSTEGLPNTIVATLYDGPTTYLQQQVKNTYDAYDNIIEKDESDFDPCTGSPCPTNSSPTWLRKTYTTYASDAALINAHIVNKPSKIVVAYGDGTPVSLTSYTYDSRGNVLTEDKCLSISGLGSAASCSSAWETKFVHDTTGQVTQRIDGNGTSVAATTTYTWGLLANGFVTQVQHPNGANDFYTYYTQIGQVQTHTDWNSRTTNYAYADPLNRITSITAPQTVDGTTGANGSGITTYTYNDGAGGFSVQEQHKMDASGTMTSTTKYFDGLGRETGTITASPQCASGIHVDTVYDSMSRVYSVSNPYCSTSDPTYGTTIYQYDALGRKNQTTLPGGAVSLINYAGNATENTDPSNGTTSVQHIQQIDGLGRLIKVCEVSSAALGTDSSPSSCGLNISGSGYLTSYTYDPLGNMWSVNQHGLSRSFVYDSLSRLTQAMNPETGSSPDLYTYSTPGASCSPDPSVPCTRTDVRGVVTAYQYDSMSRLTGKSYSAGSGNTTGPISDLSSCYQYDTALSGVTDANPKGQLTAEWQQAGSCPSSAVTSLPPGAVAVRIRSQHDAVGRVGLDQQCLTGGSCSSTTGNFVYSYNLLGSPVQANNGIFAGTVSASQIGIPNSTTISAPSLTWKTTYDSAPHLAQVFIQDQPGTSQFPVASTGAAFSSFPTLLKAISYDPFDHMTIGQLGIPYGSSTPPLSISRQYDVRGRIQNEADQGMLTSSPSSGSTGSITISGSEQSQQQQTQAATQSSASITISGSGRSKKVYDSGCNCFDWVTDGGDVEVTVNGFVGYGSYGAVTDTPTIVAASLASSLNRSGSPVTATYSGPTVTLTSKATGAAVNYSLSYASNYDDNYWSTPAFTFTTAPSAMSGGHDATYTTGYDSGTVSATINSHTATVSWGNGSSSSTIASALASAISSTDSSFLTATSSGGVVNLASLGTGSTTNWSIQVSVTYDTAHFSSSSFTASPSGMAGGSDSGATYGAIYSYQVPAGGYAPNGNILQHSDSVMGTWSFGYDAVDRLTSSHQTASTSTSTQYGNMYGCWSYDTRGNRTSEAISTTNCTSSPTPQNVTAYSANNQISSSTLSPNTLASGSFIYDASGNTLYDGNNEYWYDAEGQLCAVQSLRYGAGTVYQYAYDPEGARIAKGTMSTAPAAFTKIGASLGSSPTCAPPSGSNFVPTTRYLVDLSGQQVTELNLTTGQWQHSNIFAGGKLVATYDLKGIHFGLTDPLGTKRVQANAQGQVDQQCTGLPFGNDVNNPPSVNCAQTTNGLQTNGDATEHHFTQKERDSETGNDYFFARYYTAALGRFTTPDWSAKVTPVPYAVFTDPQSLNLYAYVRNNPLTHADRDGHLDCSGKNAQGVGCVYQAAWNVVHGTINNATMQVLSYFYAKGGNGEGIGVNDIKVGPVRFDFVHRVKGEDVTRTTDGKTVEKVIQEDGFKVGVEQLKIGLSKTTTQVGGEKPKTEWVRGFDFGKFEGENAEIGLGWGGCMIRCGQIGIGIRADRVVEDISTFLKNNPADPNDPILLSPK